MNRVQLLASCWLFSCTLVILMSIALCQPPSWTQSKLSNILKNTLRKERLRQTIRKKLNISSGPLTPRTLETPPDEKLRKQLNASNQGLGFDTMRMPNISLVLAEATDPYRKDSMLFKIHSKLRYRLTDIDNTKIVLKLRLKPKRSTMKRKKRLMKGRKIKKDKPCLENSSGKSSEVSSKSEKLSKSIIDNPKSKKKCKRSGARKLDNNSGQGKGRKGKRKRTRRLRSREIKIIVRVLDPIRNKRRKIFIKVLQVRKTEVLSVPIPKKLFKAAADSSTHSLTVQVTCRHCKRNARMDRVFRRRKKNSSSSSNPILLNPNRPLLEIQLPYRTHRRDNNNAVVGRSRSKRQLGVDQCSNYDARRRADVFSLSPSRRCCEELNYYSFEELGLSDYIIYPQGFNTVDCLGQCEAAERRENTMLASLGASGGSSGSTSQSSSCISTSRSHLDILYFTDSNTIIPERLVNFISDSCGCGAA